MDDWGDFFDDFAKMRGGYRPYANVRGMILPFKALGKGLEGRNNALHRAARPITARQFGESRLLHVTLAMFCVISRANRSIYICFVQIAGFLSIITL